MIEWLTEDFLKAIFPRLIAVLITVGAAHSHTLQDWGVSVDWTTLGGKITSASAVFIGLFLAHHVDKAIKGD